MRVLMFRTKTQQESHWSSTVSPLAPSRALDWMWQYLRDVPYPQILDCGPVRQATLDVLLKRGSKIYVADLLTPALNYKSRFVSEQDRTAVFLTDEFLKNLPPIPPGSLSVMTCWHLLDLLPRNALSDVVEKLWSYLRPGGVLFCLLREPQLADGAETAWWFHSLTVIASDEKGGVRFPHPALTNREIERLIPGGNVKTFLTRSAHREMIAIK